LVNPVNKLDFLIQQVLPTVYDDSLSFYELVNKVVIKLNEVIDQSNEYFSQNLEAVVTAILEDWETTGRLDDVINSALMEGKLDTNVFTSFEADINDQLTDVDAALLTKNFKYSGSPEEYGAKADGVTDDTAFIQQCLNENQVTVLRDRDYKITKMLKLPRNHSIQGNGGRILTGADWQGHNMGGTVDLHTILWVEAREPIFESELDMKTKFVKDLRIKGHPNFNHVGMFFGTVDNTVIDQGTTVNYSTFGMMIENVSCDKMYHGFKLSECWGSQFVGCQSGECRGMGIAIKGQVVNNTFVNCQFSTHGAGNSGVFIEGLTYQGVMKRPEGLMFSNCFIGYASYGVQMIRGLAVSFTNCIIDLNASGLNITDAVANFTDCWIQADTFPVVTLQPLATIENGSAVTLKGCYLMPTGADNISIDIGMRQNGVTIIGCYFSRTANFGDATTAVFVNSWCLDPQTTDPKIIVRPLANVSVGSVRFKTTGVDVTRQNL
jgi:hypothetical protein